MGTCRLEVLRVSSLNPCVHSLLQSQLNDASEGGMLPGMFLIIKSQEPPSARTGSAARHHPTLHLMIAHGFGPSLRWAVAHIARQGHPECFNI